MPNNPHSIYSPSAANLWQNCPGYIHLQKRSSRSYVPEKLLDAAAEGTAAHEVAAKMFNLPAPPENIQPILDFDGSKGPWDGASRYVGSEVDGILITQEIADSVDIYTAVVSKTVFSGARTSYGFERRLKIPHIHRECFGTVDAYVVDYDNKILHVFDFKHGFKVVNAQDNPQLICYAAGLPYAEVDQVHLHIVQPRAFAYKEVHEVWKISRADFIARGKVLRARAHEAENGKGLYRTGDYCSECLVSASCPAIRKEALRAMDLTGDPSGYLSREKLGPLLTQVTRSHKLLTAYKDALEAQATAIRRKGRLVPGWDLRPGKGRLIYNINTEELLLMADLCNEKIPVKPVTPKQALDAGCSKLFIDSVSTQQKGALKLKQSNYKDFINE